MDRIIVGGKTDAVVRAEKREEDRLRVNDESRAYLRETDWQVIKVMEAWLAETGRLASGFISERDAARDKVE
jgi:hypothetical protein